jgi:outer membrane protein insertion porin family
MFYLENGFFFSSIDTVIEPDHIKKRVKLTFKIFEGPRSNIDTITYLGLDQMSIEFLSDFYNNALIKKGDPFNKQFVMGELKRILTTFVNSGFINVKIDTVLTRRFASTNNISILFSVNPGSQYKVGGIEVNQDSTTSAVLDTSIAVMHLKLKIGDLYSEQKRLESEMSLSRLGVYEANKVEMVTPSRTDSNHIINLKVSVRSRELREFTPEVGADDENNAFNLLIGAGYNDRNFFGDARNYSIKLRLRMSRLQSIDYARVFGSLDFKDTSLVSRMDVVMQLTQPYFFTNDFSFTAQLASIIDKKEDYYIPIINTKLGVSARVSPFTRGMLEWTLEWIRPQGLSKEGERRMLASLPTIFQPQANSIISTTLQNDLRNDIFDPSTGTVRFVSFEWSGLFSSTISDFFGSSLSYSQYIKGTISASWYWDPLKRRSLIWAIRARGGIAKLYGDSPGDVPLTRRFFGGGSSSVRGWNARELGAFPSPQNGGTTYFEFSGEGRWHPFKGEAPLWVIPIDKISLVTFIDAGNVWAELNDVKGKEIAVANGIGIRWDTVVGPIRIDFGWRIYDPSASQRQRWITSKRFFYETMRGGVLHLGIGHPF